jgi:hypothetical protein
MDISLHRGSVEELGEGSLFTGTSREGEIFLSGELLLGNPRYT